MSFATEKEKSVTDRFMLVRLEPGRYVNDDLAASGSLYSMTFPYPVAKVERNGVELTNDGATPNADGEWLYTESTQSLQVYSSSAPSSSVIFVVYYYVFVTNEKLRILPQDPESAESASNPLRSWEPRLLGSPKIKQSIGNNLVGVFSIENTSIDISNLDDNFQQYLSLNDSFFNKDCRIWFGLNNSDSLQKVYLGKCRNIRLDSRSVNIDVQDNFSRLNQPCLNGDTGDEAYYTEAGFADIDPQKFNTPVPLVYGPFSRWKDEVSYAGFVSSGGGGTRVNLLNEFTSDTLAFWNEATCIDYSTDPTSTSENRIWALCRVPSGGFRSTNFGSPTGITDNGTNIRLNYDVSGWAALDVEKYDFCAIHQGGATGYFQLTSINIPSRRLTLYADTEDVASGFTVGGMTIVNSNAPQVIVVDEVEGMQYQSFWGKDWTFSETTTSGGNKLGKVTFNSSVESALSYDRNIHPRSVKVYYRVRGQPIDHSDVVQELCESVGLTVDATSFAAAQSALDKQCIFQIPQFDETDFKAYLDYIKLVLESTLGVLYLKNDFSVGYSLLDAPSSSTVIDSNTYLRDSLRVDLNYEDIVTFLIAYNSHIGDPGTLVYTESGSASDESAKAKHLHGINNVNRFRHVLNDITSRVSDILDLRSNRLAKYRYKTSTQDLDSELNDDLQLESDLLLGNDTEKDLKIVGLDKGLDDTEIEATDLGGL